MHPAPHYIEHRIKMFDELKAEYDEFIKSEQPTTLAPLFPLAIDTIL